MTLIVAKKFQESIVIVSDTQKYNLIASWNEKILNPQIKIAIFEKKYAVCFAGIIEFAQDAIDEVRDIPAKDATSILEVLEKYGRLSGWRTEFILASNDDFKIYQIKNETIEDVHTAWLGNHEGYNLFQTAYLGQPLSIEHEPGRAFFSISKQLESEVDANHLNKMKGAMSLVINSDSPSVSDVGGFCISAYAEVVSNAFTFGIDFLRISKLLNDSDFPISDIPTPINFGDAASGAYAFDLFPCEDDFRISPAIYFETGQFFMFWEPGKFSNCIKISNVVKVEVVAFIKDEFNLIAGLGCGWADYLNKGIKDSSLGSYDHALVSFNESVRLLENDNNNPEAWIIFEKRGLLFLTMGQYDNALDDFERGLNIMNQASLFNNIGVVHSRIGNSGLALYYFDRAYNLEKSQIYLDNLMIMKNLLGIL